MDIILKDVETNSGYITFTCPVCGADAHVSDSNASEVFWMIVATCKHKDPAYYGNSRLPSGRCAICGCKG